MPPLRPPIGARRGAACCDSGGAVERLLEAARPDPTPLAPEVSRAILDAALRESRAGFRPDRGRVAAGWGAVAAALAIAAPHPPSPRAARLAPEQPAVVVVRAQPAPDEAAAAERRVEARPSPPPADPGPRLGRRVRARQRPLPARVAPVPATTTYPREEGPAGLTSGNSGVLAGRSPEGDPPALFLSVTGVGPDDSGLDGPPDGYAQAETIGWSGDGTATLTRVTIAGEDAAPEIELTAAPESGS